MPLISSPSLRRAALILILIVSGGGVLLQLAVTTEIYRGQGRGFVAALWFVLLFFTILTNIIVACAAFSTLRDVRGTGFLSTPSAQSAVALYIAVVGIVYSVVLRALWKPEGWQYAADLLIHDAAALLFVLYWLVFVPKGRLQWSDPARWLLYPLLYLAYALMRGAIEGVYPYPFIDAAKIGVAATAANALTMLALFVALGLTIVAIDRFLGRRRAPPT